MFRTFPSQITWYEQTTICTPPLPHRILLSRTVSMRQTGRYGSTRMPNYSEHCTMRTSGIGFRFSILLQSTFYSKSVFSFVNLWRPNDELNCTALSAVPGPVWLLILQCLILVFLKLLSPGGCFSTLRIGHFQEKWFGPDCWNSQSHLEPPVVNNQQ